jgi:hypothetical protein
MNIGYVCLPRKALVISVWGKNVTLDQWYANIRKQIADPGFAQTKVHLVDVSRGTADPSIGEAEIQGVLDFISGSGAPTAGRKIAIVAGEEFARLRLYERLAEPLQLNVIVFNDLGTACTWLGIDPREVEIEIRKLRAEIHGGS